MKDGSADERAFADELQRLAGQGGFDPLALLGARPTFHSVFLAPFSPALRAARDRYLADGGGPLAGIEAQLRLQGAPDPAAAARHLLATAQGMCIAVLAGDHGVASVPQLFVGHLDEAWIEQSVAAMGDGFPDGVALRTALAALRRLAEAASPWPRLVAGRDPIDPAVYWPGLAAGVVTTLDSALPSASRERLADLAHWCVAAVDALGGPADDDARTVHVRLRLAAGDVAGAGRDLAALLAAGCDDGLADLLEAFVRGAVRAGCEADAAAWLGLNLESFDAAVGPLYETAAALFRLRAAAAAPASQLLAVAAQLAARDRKAMRQDLTREPIWRVRAALAGELVDTAEAARLVDRSPAFIAKRLDQGTIPTCEEDGRLRLPRAALLAWKEVMDAHGLLK